MHIAAKHYAALVNANVVKYLGVVLDTNLNFCKHIDLLCTRTRKLIYFRILAKPPIIIGYFAI